MTSEWLIILAIFLYFLFKWLFRIIFILFIAKLISTASKQKIESIKRGIEDAVNGRDSKGI